MKAKLKILLVLMLAGCLIFQVPSALTFGDFDSDSDWGGSDSDYDWDSDHRSNSGRKGSGQVSVFGILWLLLVFTGCIWMLIFCIRCNIGSGTNASRCSGGRRLEDMQKFYENHPEAKAYDLRSFVRKLFTDMQEGWEEGNIENVRDRFVPDTWNRFNNQLAAKNARGEVTHVRDILLERIELKGWYRMNGGDDEVTVTFDALSNIWTTDRSGNIISGSETRRLDQVFEWTLVYLDTVKKSEVICPRCGRKTDASFAACPHCGNELQGADVKPAREEPVEETENTCPNCGKKVDGSSFAACPYCGSELKRKGIWLLKHIDAKSQRTLHA